MPSFPAMPRIPGIPAMPRLPSIPGAKPFVNVVFGITKCPVRAMYRSGVWVRNLVLSPRGGADPITNSVTTEAKIIHSHVDEERGELIENWISVSSYASQHDAELAPARWYDFMAHKNPFHLNLISSGAIACLAVVSSWR